MSGPRFDRIVPLVTLVLVGLGVVFLLELNTASLQVNLGQNIPTFSVAWPLIGLLAMVTGIGVELVARAEPHLYDSGWVSRVQWRARQIELALPLWIVPALTPVAVFAFFRLFKGALATNAYLLVLVATGMLLLAVLVAQHYLIEGTPASRQTARTVQSVVAYALIFAICSAVTFNRYRTLYAVALVFPSALLFAAAILRGRVAALWTTASVIALVMVESYWTLNYWPAPFFFNSAGLLVIFYVLTGLAQAASTDDHAEPGDQSGLTRRTVIEYSIVGSGALIALAVTAMWWQAQNAGLRAP